MYILAVCIFCRVFICVYLRNVQPKRPELTPGIATCLLVKLGLWCEDCKDKGYDAVRGLVFGAWAESQLNDGGAVLAGAIECGLCPSTPK